MKKLFILALAVVLLAGCAQNARNRSENKLIQENEQRLASLEESVTALSTQVAQLNNRVYEVRTRNGQKTSMTVVPIVKNPPAQAAPVATPVAPTPAAAASAPVTGASASSQAPEPVTLTGAVATPEPSSPAARPAAAKQPAGRKIDPKAKPGPLPAKAKAAVVPKAQPASGSIGTPAASAAAPLVEPGLPPAELPSESVPPVPQGNVTPELPPIEATPPIPLPVAPVSDLSLPPEQVQPASATPAAPATPAKASAPATPASKSRPAAQARGEQAAYNAALNAARSGKTAEGIRLFRDFLQKYPNGQYAANAEYWIGECLYSQGKYKDALSEFQNVNNSYPAHHKNADALLKAGLTLGKMGDKAGAAEKFRAVIANFPHSEAAKRARALSAN